jgi:DNA-binding transcriptional LysR family regulator
MRPKDVGGRLDCGHGQLDGSRLRRWRQALHTEAQGRVVALFGQLDTLPRQGVCLAFQERLDGHGRPMPGAPKFRSLIRRLGDLLRHALIDSSFKKVRWPDWFAANGITAPALHGMHFDRSFLAISTAVNGLGIALESTRLAESEIADGRLIPILKGMAVDVHYTGHYLVFPRLALRRQTLQIFTSWITAELGIDKGQAERRS